MKHLLIFLIFLSFLSLYECKDSSVSPAVPMLYNYYPVKEGNTWYYELDSLKYSSFSSTNDSMAYKVDTLHYQLKDVLSSSYIDDSGQKRFTLERYLRKDANSPWKIADIWTTTRDDKSALVTEENTTYVKLIFPPQNDQSWNGNAYNTLGDQSYQYSEINQPGQVGNLKFDSVLTVVQQSDSNFVINSYSSEKYAAGVGLIYKESRYINTQTNNDGKITKDGYKFYQRLTGFKKK